MIKEFFFGGGGASDKVGDTGLLIARVFVGLSMAIAHGLGKVQNPGQIIGGLTKMNFPMPTVMGWSAALAEFLGGILLAIGLLTRPAAAVLGFTMAVAAFIMHGSDPYGKKEMALLYLALCVVFLFTGGGRFSIDRLIKKG